MTQSRDPQRDLEILSRYFSDPTGDVFVCTGLPGWIGAIFARYSRAPGGLRETFLREFIDYEAVDRHEAKLTGLMESISYHIGNFTAIELRQLMLNGSGELNKKKLTELMERILIKYGDDSVKELEGSHLSLENMSVLATKDWEDRRIGGSPIEQSTRYVFFDKRDPNGTYRYYRDNAVMNSPHANAYVTGMDFVFDTYCEGIPLLKKLYEERLPLEVAEYDINDDQVKERWSDLKSDKDRKDFLMTYNADLRTKACDVLRAILPLSTKTNVGIHANARYLENTLSYCYTSDLPESRDLAASAHRELNKTIPVFVKRAARNEYLVGVRRSMQALADELLTGTQPATLPLTVNLLDDGAKEIARHIKAWCGGTPTSAESVSAALRSEKDALTIACMLYPYADHPLTQLRELVRRMPESKRQRIIDTYIGQRKTRRDRPGRALESGYPYTFDNLTDFGTFKDLERHRMVTQQRQHFSPKLGFTMPDDLKTVGLGDKVESCVQRMIDLHIRLEKDFPEQAQYTTLHGSLVPWMIGCNDRAFGHMAELRTTPQGHPSYRLACQSMHTQISIVSPIGKAATQFVDHESYTSARGDSEAKQRAKEAKLDAQKSAKKDQ